jgi:hypothetical protein
MDEKTYEHGERIAALETEIRHLRDELRAMRAAPPSSGKLLLGYFSSREFVMVAGFVTLAATVAGAVILALLLAGQGGAIADFAKALKGG